MADYKITCCSTCDLTAEHLKKLDVGFATYHYVVGGKDYPDDLYTSRSPEEFYGEIERGALPTTAQVTPEELIALIEPLLAAGYDVLHLEFSSGLSGGWLSAQAAHEALAPKYPDRKFFIVDTLAASSGYGLLVDKAAELKAGGMSVEELYRWVEQNKLRVRHWFFSTNLAHFKRGGRISGPAAAIGSMLNVCPVMDVNCEGKLIIRKKVMGKKKAIKELADAMVRQAEGGADYRGKCYLSHSLRRGDAEQVASLVQAAFPSLDGEAEIDDIGTVIGSHTGTGTVALFFFSSSKRDL